ncbi:hypothetical protein SAMN05192574_102182 [Mucilaginibacter gossypiicola]|uniref:Uncharacterized protein n=1 Tax=Mucilaginibacter gossypiicola TaxID=551995 RepID=A0A1H8D2T1_9SPHI|nr:hypothetical protein [Mucilaginibacter gossypiicola]SEN01499.1 hypothetical protein SAMN05192574_102182 [Mucilaginibacter gossypiicola]
MKNKVLGVLAIVIALSASAFTTKKANSNFYIYTGSTSQADIQNISNYQSSTLAPCSGSSDVCGVTMTTSRPAGQTPVASEFNAEKANLWSSQQGHAAADGNIEMKN